MKLRFFLVPLFFSLPALGAETFTCASSAQSEFVANLTGKLYRFQDRQFLSYGLSVKESCEESSCLDLTEHSYKFLESRAAYQPIKYVDHLQFVLPLSADGSKESIGDWQFIVPSSTGEEFDSQLLLSLPEQGRGVTVTMSCQGDHNQEEGLPEHLPHELLPELFGIDASTLTINSDLLKDYEKGSAITLSDALARAMISFLNDVDAPESPLAIAWYAAEYDWSITLGQSEIKDFIIPKVYLKGAFQNGRLALANINYPPEGGESYQNNWIFTLTLPMSDHIYWAIVPKSGTEKAYNYGFN